MDKTQLLKIAAHEFQQRLIEASVGDADAVLMLESVAPLLASIAAGEITPPAENVYRPCLHSEHVRYGSGTRLFSAESEFLSALEDWRSKAWYPK